MYVAKNGHSANGAIIGMLLGDSSLGGKLNAFLSTEHGSKYRDYLEFKRAYLSSYLSGDIKQYRRKINDCDYDVVKWISPADKRLNYHRQDFYPNGEKIVKASILNRLTTLGLALWYLDDGSIKSGPNGRFETVRIHCNGFDDKSHKVIVDWFESRFGFKFSIENDGAIHTTTSAGWRFLAIVKPFVDRIPSLAHKADTHRWNTDVISYHCLPDWARDRLEGRDISVPDRGYVWQLFTQDKLWPLQICRKCGIEFRRKRESYFCSENCNKQYSR